MWGSNVILQQNDQWEGTGHNSVVRDEAGTRLDLLPRHRPRRPLQSRHRGVKTAHAHGPHRIPLRLARDRRVVTLYNKEARPTRALITLTFLRHLQHAFRGQDAGANDPAVWSSSLNTIGRSRVASGSERR